MPIIKSAIKKQRQDVARTKRNKKYTHDYVKAVRDIKKGKSTELKEAYSKIDRAAKKKVIHKKRASRLKSLISRITKKSAKK